MNALVGRRLCSCIRIAPAGHGRHSSTMKELPFGLTSLRATAPKTRPGPPRLDNRPPPIRMARVEKAPIDTSRPEIQLSRPRRDEEIKARIITLVDEQGQLRKNVRLDKALQQFDRQRYFLIEVDPNAEQPVCRLFDKKELYEKQKASRKKRPSPESVTKEIVFGWHVSHHDMDHKLGRVRQFLEKGNKVKIDIVTKKGQAYIEKDAQQQLIRQVTEHLKPFPMTKKPTFVSGGSCILMFENRT